MRWVVVDSSVLVKLVLEEEGSSEALHLLEASASGSVRLAAPELGALEFASVLDEHRRRGRLRPEEVDSGLQELLAMGIQWFPALPLLDRGVELARRTGQGVYDGTFLALASALGAALVTADRRLLQACRGKVEAVRELRDVRELVAGGGSA